MVLMVLMVNEWLCSFVCVCIYFNCSNIGAGDVNEDKKDVGDDIIPYYILPYITLRYPIVSKGKGGDLKGRRHHGNLSYLKVLTF